MAEHRTPDHIIESSPRSFRCWFKNRLPPSPTLQAGSQLWMLVKICTSWQEGESKKMAVGLQGDRKSTRLNSSHRCISYAVFCLKKKKNTPVTRTHKTS